MEAEPGVTSPFGLEPPYRLNWGCGPVQPAGWLNVDCDPQWDTWRTTVDLPAGCCQLIVANHSLQMVPYHDLVPTLAELRRVTMPGGAIRILVPDAERAAWALVNHDDAWFRPMVADEVEPTVGGKYTAYIGWYGEARTQFTLEALATFLDRAGWGFPLTVPATYTATPWGDIFGLDSRSDESLIVEARNPT